MTKPKKYGCKHILDVLPGGFLQLPEISLDKGAKEVYQKEGSSQGRGREGGGAGDREET